MEVEQFSPLEDNYPLLPQNLVSFHDSWREGPNRFVTPTTLWRFGPGSQAITTDRLWQGPGPRRTDHQAEASKRITR